MRCKLVGLKNALYRSQADPGRLGQHSAGPVRHLSRWRCQCKIDDMLRDAELRLMWDEAPVNGAELRKFVASLQTALAE